MYTHTLSAFDPEAPYTPVAGAGLLFALREPDATLRWVEDDDPLLPPRLRLTTVRTLPQVATTVADAPWPVLDSLDWPRKPGQAIKPSLEGLDDPAAAWRELAGMSQAPEKRSPAAQLVAALLTDGALDRGVPGRNRLLRGVKSDLSGVGKPPRKPAASELEMELGSALTWLKGRSGWGLGLVPEVQTFGGTTGPDPSNVGTYSPLLYRLCWLGVMAMPPFGVLRGVTRSVGGPLFAEPIELSWPVWTMPLGLTPLIALFGAAEVHMSKPDIAGLRARGVAAVYRSHARPISQGLLVFGRGRRVA